MAASTEQGDYSSEDLCSHGAPSPCRLQELIRRFQAWLVDRGEKL